MRRPFIPPFVLLAAFASPALYAGVPYVIVAGGECPPNDPECVCDEDPLRGGGTQTKCDPYLTYIPHGVSGISQVQWEHFERLPREEPADHIKWIPGQGILLLGNRSVTLTNPFTGKHVFSKDLTGLVTSAPVDAIVNATLQAFDLLLKDGGIVRYQPSSDTLTTIIPGGWTTGALRAVRITIRDQYFIAEALIPGGAFQLFELTPAAQNPLGAPRPEPFLALVEHLEPGPPQTMAVAMLRDGRLVHVTPDGEWFMAAPATPPIKMGAFVLTSSGLEGWGMEPSGRLHRTIISTGTTSSADLPELASGTELAVGASMPSFMGTAIGSDAGVDIVDDTMSVVPNINRLEMPVIASGVERRVAVGSFGAIPGLDAPEMFVSEYDPTLASSTAHEVGIYSLLLKDAAGRPAKLGSFVPYPGARGGSTLATLRVTGRTDLLLTGSGPAPMNGPLVAAWDVTNPSSPSPVAKFYAYGSLRYGVNVAAGDIDGDGQDEIVTGAGIGAVFGPHVRGFELDAAAKKVTVMPAVNFFAYQTLKYGVRVAVADTNGDRRAEIITGPGPGSTFGGQLRSFRLNGSRIESAGLNVMLGTNCQGAHPAAADIDGNGHAEVLATLGVDPKDTIFTLEDGKLERREEIVGTSSAIPFRIVFGSDGTWLGQTTETWPIGQRIFAEYLTNAWITFHVDTGTCEDSGTAIFLLPGGVPVTSGHFAYTAQDDVTQLGITATVDAQITINSMSGTVSLTSSKCGTTKSMSFIASRQ